MFEKITTIDINFDTMTQQTQTLTSGDTGTMLSITLPDDTPTNCRLAYQSVNEKGAVINSVSYVEDVSVTTSALLEFPPKILGYQGYVELSIVCNRGSKGRSLGTVVTFELKQEQSDMIAQTVFPKTIIQFDNLYHEAQEKQQTLLNQLDTQAKAMSKRIELKQREAIDSLSKQTDLTSDVAQSKSNMTDSVNGVKDVATSAIATINSQTDLSPEVTTAKSAIAKSASDTQVVADNATTAINKVVTDTQTLGQSESTKITAVLPQLQTQIQTTANNAETIKQQLQDATFPAKLTTAYVQGLNGEGFSLMPYGENKLLSSTITDIRSNDSTNMPISIQTLSEDGDYFVRIKRSSTTLSPTYFSIYNLLDKINDLSGNKVTISVKARASDVADFKLLAACVNPTRPSIILPDHNKVVAVGTDWAVFSSTFIVPDGYKYFRFLPSITTLNEGQIDSFYLDLKEWKVELANTMGIPTPWTPAPSDPGVTPLDYLPKYKGYGTLQSTNPSDYQWDLNPEYLLAKQQVSDDKLKQAIIAIGGTV